MPFSRQIQTDSLTDIFTHTCCSPNLRFLFDLAEKSDRCLMQWADKADYMQTEALFRSKPHIMGNKASTRHHVTQCAGMRLPRASQPSKKRAGAATAQRHVDANCCSNFCAVGLLYRTPNWQEVTSLHKHLLRDAQAFGDMMDVSSRQILTNILTIQSHLT